MNYVVIHDDYDNETEVFSPDSEKIASSITLDKSEVQPLQDIIDTVVVEATNRTNERMRMMIRSFIARNRADDPFILFKLYAEFAHE